MRSDARKRNEETAMSADFAHALDDGQAEYRDAAGGDMEALAESMQPTAGNHDSDCAVFLYRDPVRMCTCLVWPTLLRAAGRLLAAPTEPHHSARLADLLAAQRARTAAAIRAEADRICAQRGCHVAGNDHAELMKWAGVFARVVERGES